MISKTAFNNLRLRSLISSCNNYNLLSSRSNLSRKLFTSNRNLNYNITTSTVNCTTTDTVTNFKSTNLNTMTMTFSPSDRRSSPNKSNGTTVAEPKILSTHHRSHTCGDLRLADVGKEVTLSGWVQISRDKNHFAFIDVRDRHGITQVVVDNPGNSESEDRSESDKKQLQLYQSAKALGREVVIKVTGLVCERPNKNKERATGEIEVKVQGSVASHNLIVLSEALPPPLKIEDKTDANEDTCMKYRFLDLRRPVMQQRLLLRQKITNAVRNGLCHEGFCEIETPMLIKSTPEGARDFLVPSSRLAGASDVSKENPESNKKITPKFYALPQSPQTFKQLLMCAGMDRYFQIARCFRDEELRADRQPEFTQIDCEMSFVNREDILTVFEGMMTKVFKDCGMGDKLIGVNSKSGQYPRLDYKECMLKYGIDKPDIRYDMLLTDLTEIVGNQMKKRSESDESTKSSYESFTPFETSYGPKDGPGGIAERLIIGINIENGGSKFSSSKKLKELDKRAKTEVGAKFMVWIKVNEEIKGSVGDEESVDVKSLNPKMIETSLKIANPNDTSAKPGHFTLLELRNWCIAAKATKPNDILCIFAGPGGSKRGDGTREVVGKWRHVMGTEMGLRPTEGKTCTFAPLWVVNFPLLEWGDDEASSGPNGEVTGRWHAKHHPFTRPIEEDEEMLLKKYGTESEGSDESNTETPIDLGLLYANAYDLVINGVEVGGGSLRISNRKMQEIMFTKLLGFTMEEAKTQFGFLLNAFEYGVPPHGGAAFGLDRLVAMIAGTPDNIRMVMAFPKNSTGKDVMIEAPSEISEEQMKECGLI